MMTAAPQAIAEPIALIANRGDVKYWPTWLDPNESSALFGDLIATGCFTRVWVGQGSRRVPPTFEICELSQPWPPSLVAVHDRLASMLMLDFSLKIQKYRDGRDFFEWHADGNGTRLLVVASLSLGATRRFELRPNLDWEPTSRPEPVSMELSCGDVLVMSGETQLWWEHRIRRDPNVTEGRIALTFRAVYGDPLTKNTEAMCQALPAA
jgi:alkylated DNA repair dioxygenase AlkB